MTGARVYCVGFAEGDERLAALRRAFGDVRRVAGTIPTGGDCAVVDHREGAFDGPDAIEAIAARRPALPVVLAPTDGGEAVASRAVAAGAAEYVPERGDVVAGVRRALDPSGGRSSRGRAIGDGGTPRMPIRDLEVTEELRLKERAMDEAPVGITIADADHPDDALIYLNEAFERMTGYPVEECIGTNCRFLQGERSDPEAIGRMREAIDNGEPVSVELRNYRRDGEEFWNSVRIAPIRDGDGEVTHFVGFQTDVTERKRAEFAVERERRNLDHLLSRINGLIGDVTRDLVEAVSREAAERSVCERMVEPDAYESAWIGEPEIGGDGIVERARAGEDPPERSSEVAARAAETRDLQVVDDGDGGIAAVPLAYGETLYGVLTVRVSEADALDERETAVLGALGRAIATAINALESTRILTADNVVELEFEVRDPGLFFVDLSARADCRLEFEGSVSRDDGSLLAFFSSDADPERLLAAAADVGGIAEATLISEGDSECVFEFRLEGDSVVTALAERGAKTRRITAEGGEGRLLVELPAEADARAIVRRLQERHPRTELMAYRERERPPKTKAEYLAELEDRLTDRQLTALRKAYVSGFYEWSRPTSGNELAASMGISRSTFHQHLRAAERKLVGEFFER